MEWYVMDTYRYTSLCWIGNIFTFFSPNGNFRRKTALIWDRGATQALQVAGEKRNVAHSRRSGIWPNYIIAMLYCVRVAGWSGILAYFMSGSFSEFCQHALTPAPATTCGADSNYSNETEQNSNLFPVYVICTRLVVLELFSIRKISL